MARETIPRWTSGAEGSWTLTTIRSPSDDQLTSSAPGSESGSSTWCVSLWAAPPSAGTTTRSKAVTSSLTEVATDSATSVRSGDTS